uniref:Uncharacterized protein n=1 Tax=Globisporangium ultimum (strain ATCC 200006 / CBS 805.95 / DAOM BR144) TaxID=431595 RepID=K3WGP0_GLOUD
MCVTAYWSPEIIKRQPQDFGVDMWAFGVLAYITLTGVHPFDPKGDQSDAEIVRAIAKGEYDVKNPWYRDLSNEAKDFVAKLLQSDPSKRLTAKDALAHTWLKGKMVSTEPLAVGHTERLLAFQRLQHLRANILAVIMGVQHSKLAQAATADRTQSEDDSSHVPARTTTVNMDMFKDTFALFDKDESGGIDRDELEAAMCALGQRLSRSELDAIMQQADSDGDGKISFLEFASMMNQRLFRQGELTEADLKSAFDIYDTNHDGFISSSELAYMLHLLGKHTFTDEDVASIIDVADTNHDGQIDYAEFCQLMRHVGAKRDAGSGSP